MIVGIPKETYPGERRVALIPAQVTELKKVGLDVVIEPGAGSGSGFTDEDYTAREARLANRGDLYAEAQLIVQVRGYGANPERGHADLALMREGQSLFGLYHPLDGPELIQELARKNVNAVSMELMPRISRAQSMDVLSSMATIAGYKAVLHAAEVLPRIFPMLMTAAGTLAPARVFVIGVGVAGLQALATARRLGAVCSAYDVRPAVKDQVQSVGARFVEFDLNTADAEDAGGYAKEQSADFLRRQREQMAKVIAEHDVVITTANIPGKKAPILVTEDMVRGMATGSVIIDLAAERGGNCKLTELGKTVVRHGISIVGPDNLASGTPYHASQLYSKNIANLLTYLVEDGKMELDREDEIVHGILLTQGGEVVHEHLRELLGLASRPPAGIVSEA